MKPVLVYDNDFRPAHAWTADLHHLTGEAVAYCPDTEVHDKQPGVAWEIPTHDPASIWHFVDEHGTRFGGAAALFEVLSLAPRRGWITRAYYRSTLFAALCDRAFEAIARRRRAFATLHGIASGRRDEPATYHYTHWFFLRAFAVIILIAFLSLWYQIEGLAGDAGLVPATATLVQLEALFPEDHARIVPSLMWLHPHAITLHLLCIAGVLCAILALTGFLMPLALGSAVLCYLSLMNVTGPFLRFQWDILLIESGILATLFAAWRFRAGPNARIAPSLLIRLLLRWLLFRLMFSSGIVKMGDTTWTDLRALDYHLWSQPLPHLGSWYASHAPHWAHAWALAGMFFVYLVVPFFYFGPRNLRAKAGLATIALQLALIATGNHGFFNLLILVLCIPLFDDLQLRKFLSTRARTSVMPPTIRVQPAAARHAITGAAFAILFPASLYLFLLTCGWQLLLPSQVRSAIGTLYDYRIVSTYGLYPRVLTDRPEIIIEGTRDGIAWEAYEFRWKPGALDRRPAWSTPHMPRLDWQMAFAALGDAEAQPWFHALMVRLLENEPSVTRLLRTNPFEDDPPERVRAMIYRYQFTEWEDFEATGNYWMRTPLGVYAPEMRLGWDATP